jgi:hypothetical protein
VVWIRAVRRLPLVAAAAVCACIERPWQDAPARRNVDRGSLSDVLLTAVPADLTPVGAVFGGLAELVGYRVEPATLVPGQRTRLTLVWRCRAEMDLWHIFVHLDDGAGNRIHAEHDPASGRYPTDAWRPGDLISDSIVFTPGVTPLMMYVGFYTQGENRLHLDSPGRGRDDGRDRLLAGILPMSR